MKQVALFIVLIISTQLFAEVLSFTKVLPNHKRSLKSDPNRQIMVKILPSALKKDSSILIDLPDNLVVTLKNGIFNKRKDGDFSWIGKASDALSDGYSILTTKKGATYGVIRYNGKRYILKKLVDGNYSITYKEEGNRALDDAIEVPMKPSSQFRVKPKIAKSAVQKSSQRMATTYVDVMILYTQAYADDAGSGLAAQIQVSIDYANLALQNSNINMQYRLDYTFLYQNSNANESVDIATALNYLANDNVIKILRAQEKSDLVSLFRLNKTIDAGGETVGLGYLGYYIYNQGTANEFNQYDVTSARALAYNISEYDELTFVHEAGHNLGCGHSHDLGCTGLYSYSCGYQGTQGTVMSYAQPPLQYFSDPNLFINNEFIGIAEGNANAADCARTIKETMLILSQVEESDFVAPVAPTSTKLTPLLMYLLN